MSDCVQRSNHNRDEIPGDGRAKSPSDVYEALKSIYHENYEKNLTFDSDFDNYWSKAVHKLMKLKPKVVVKGADDGSELWWVPIPSNVRR